MSNLHGILLAYSRNLELKDLTLHRTLASVPYGGRYRVIDFILSSMVNAGVSDVGVVMHASYQSLLDHLGSGKDWDLARRSGGLRLLPPFAYAASDRHGNSMSVEYRGTMDALAGVYSYLKEIRQDYVVIADAHTIINIDLKDVLAQHIASGADITTVVSPKYSVNSREAIYYGTDDDGRVNDVIIHPAAPKGMEAVNIYIMSKELLINLVDYAIEHDVYSFSRGILLPRKDELKIMPYVFNGYRVHLQDVQSYYDNSMKLLDHDVRGELFCPERPVRTKERNDASTYYAPGSKVVSSMIADGCVIEGTVENSIIFHNVKIAKGAVVKNCIVMQSSKVEAGAELSCVITDKDVTINAGTKLNGAPNCPFTVPKGSVV